MPNPKKPVRVHLVAGTYRRDRHRQRPPDPDAIGDPPGHLTAPLQAVWRELAAALPPGIGAGHDRVAFEVLTRLVHRSREVEPTPALIAQLVKLLDSFGMSPAGRTRLDPEPPPPAEGPKTGLAAFRGP